MMYQVERENMTFNVVLVKNDTVVATVLSTNNKRKAYRMVVKLNSKDTKRTHARARKRKELLWAE